MLSEITELYLQNANTVRLVIISQAILIIFLILASPYGKRLPGYLIAAFIAIQSNYILMLCITFSGYYEVIPLSYISLTYAFLLLLGPLFYLYCQSLMIGRLTLQWSMLIHVLPTFIAWLILQPLLEGSDTSALGQLFHRGFNYVHMAHLISLMIYTGMAMRVLSHYRQHIHDTFSSLDDISLAWLSRIAILCVVISSIVFIAFATRMIMDAWYKEVGMLMRVWSLAQFMLIALAGCRSQLQLFGHASKPVSLRIETTETQPVITQDLLSSQDHAAKYGASKLDDQLVDSIWRKINEAIQERELFLDQSLSLPKLAEALSLSRHDVSQVINSVPGQNFYDLINNYRVKRARELIEANAHASKAMLDIAIEAGFSNTVTFNKHFKNLFSLTPAKYKKKYLSRVNKEV